MTGEFIFAFFIILEGEVVALVVLGRRDGRLGRVGDFGTMVI